jgi:predicted molibdopterin-dependent oxidoreductase YjgC
MTIDGRPVTLKPGMTVYEAAQGIGIRIPVLCHADGVVPAGGCGLCTVEDTAAGGKLLPACATRADAAMSIVTDSEAVRNFRRTALELLLSNHPADCEAPCRMACPSGLPVQTLMARIRSGDWQSARDLARAHPFACGGAAPCEKACRRALLDGAVAICALHRWLAGETAGEACSRVPGGTQARPRFRSRMPDLNVAALAALTPETGPRHLPPETHEPTPEAAAFEAGRCMRCGCLKPTKCRLRELCAEYGANPRAFDHTPRPVIRETGRNGFRFDASRCILCGLCVRITRQCGAGELGPAFHGRGFEARIGPPLGRVWDDLPDSVLQACAAACPTGAMAFETNAVV